MKTIYLKKNLVTEVDDIDILHLCLLFSWQYNKGNGYVMGYEKGSGSHANPVYMHHVVAARMGLRIDETIDHTDGNSLNNCRSNLRSATHSENNANSVSKGNLTGFKGVFRFRNQYQAQICVERSNIHLGLFNKAEDAAKAYDAAALRYYGLYAKGNFL